MSRRLGWIWAGWLLATPLSFGQELIGSDSVPPSVSPNGYGGIGFSPSAVPTPQGTGVLGFSTAWPGISRLSGYNLVGSFGLLPGLEINGRLATLDLQCNGYLLSECRGDGNRDLSVGFKLATPLIDRNEGALWIAAGVTDFGGAATRSRSAFAVTTWNVERWSVSAGYIDPISAQAFGSGPFASVSFAAARSVQLNAELIDRDVFATARLWVPQRWLPDALGIYADLHHQVRTERETVPETSYGVGFAIDLDPLMPSASPANPWRAVPKVARWIESWIPDGLRSRTVAESDQEIVPIAATPNPLPERAAPASEADQQAWAWRVVGALEREGFEDVAVGRRRETDAEEVWWIRFENTDYLHNDLDALAVVAGRVAEASQDRRRRVSLRLMRRGVEAIELWADTTCLQTFIARSAEFCSDQAVTIRSVDREWWSPVEWWAKSRRRSWGVPRIYVVPAIESRVGTEYGAWDASFAANVAIHVPLWRGALIEGTQIFPVSNTRDFEPGGVFSKYRYNQSENFRVMLHQAVGLPYGLSARVAVGRVGKLFEGGLAEWRWEPLNGIHKFGIEASRFKVRDEGLAGDRYARSELASYRYFNRSLQATLEAKAGRFFNGDEGFLVYSRFWFGDVSITPYYRKTKREEGYFPNRPYGRQIVPALPDRAFAGLEFSLPLAPRKGYSSRWLRANGNDRFSYGIETVVNNPSNDLLREYGQFTPVPLSLDGTVFNFDRASDAYLQSNLRRLPWLWRRSMGLGGP